MLDTLWDFTNELLGLERGPVEMEFRQMVWRGTIVFAFAVLIVRLAVRRLLGNNAGFDIIIGVIFGSVLSRAITGNAAFFPTLGTCVLLVTLHYLVAALAFRSHRISQLIKGRSHVLVRDGKVDEAVMCRFKITPSDLEEYLRLNGRLTGPEDVAEARVERNGSISVVRKPRGQQGG